MLADELAIIHKGDLIYNGLFSEFNAGMQEATLEDEFIRIATQHEMTH
jgi:ABC-type Na+ transport system ATPase subunit NatA